MELKITSKVLRDSPKDKFEIVLYFRASDIESTILFEKGEESEIFNWDKIFKEYKKKVETTWNEWCNVERSHIEKLCEEFSIEFEDEDFLSYWQEHPDYEYYDIPDTIYFYYYNEDGVKFNVEIV